MPRVLVVGSINMDTVVTTSRYPALGETVIGRDIARFPGGKGSNQAVAAAGCGVAAEFVVAGLRLDRLVWVRDRRAFGCSAVLGCGVLA